MSKRLDSGVANLRHQTPSGQDSAQQGNDDSLRRSEERYRLLVEQADDGIFHADAQGHYVDVNRAGCEMLGYTREELLGLSIADVVAAEETMRIGSEVARLSGGQIIRSEWRMRRKCGSFFVGEVVGRQLPDGHLQAILRDVSARHAAAEHLRQTEEQSRIALEAADLGTWRHDIAAGLIWYDERGRSISGFGRECVPAAEVFARMHPDDAGRMNATKDMVLEPGQSCGRTTDEFRVIDDDGTVRWLRTHVHSRFEGEGEKRRPVYAIGTIEDITARVRLREQLLRLSNAYETKSEINKCVARATSEEELLACACKSAVWHSGFRLVRVAARQHDRRPARLGPPLHYGPAADALDGAVVRDWPNDDDRLERLLATLGRNGYHCSLASATDALLGPWPPAYSESGIRAVGIFPLRVAGSIVGTMMFYSSEGDCFDMDMVRQLKEMAADISFGLDRLAEARRVRDSELRFSAVFRSSPSCILIKRLTDGRIVDANDAFLKTFGYARDEIVGHPTLETSLWADAEQRTTLFRVLDEVGRVRDFEAIWRHCSGEPRDCLISAEIVVLAGERHLSCVVTDVTERRAIDRMLFAREEEFRALAEHSPDIISRFDRDGRRLYVNQEMARSFGVALPEILGKTPTEAMPASQVARQVEAAVAQVVASATEGELEVGGTEGPGGRLVHRHIRLVPEFDAAGRLISVLAIARDISRIKETKQRLRETQQQLRELDARREEVREEERKQMAREIHDVLGQLLTALRLDIDMLGMEFGAEQPMLLERTAKSMELVDDTIAVVRNLASTLRPPSLDLGIVSALEWQAKEFSARSGVNCEISALEGEVQLDEAQAIGVFRLVQESLTNVSRHAQAHRVVVALGREGEGYRLSVSDDGIGFDPKRTRRGSLGLVGMRERAVGLGGELILHSTPGRGAEIEVCFPARRPGGAFS